MQLINPMHQIFQIYVSSKTSLVGEMGKEISLLVVPGALEFNRRLLNNVIYVFLSYSPPKKEQPPIV